MLTVVSNFSTSVKSKREKYMKLRNDHPIKLAIIEAHEIVRLGLRQAVHHNEQIRLVAEGGSADHLLSLVQRHRPDVLLLSVDTPFQLKPSNEFLLVTAYIEHIAKRTPTRVLVLSRHTHKGFIRSLLSAGAAGFRQRDEALASRQQLLKMIIELGRHGRLPLQQRLYERFYGYDLAADNVPRLTPRKIQIMQTIADHPKTALPQIADHLGIAESTLRNNLSAINRALNTQNLNGSMIECLRLGLVQLSH
jgi:two-component system response regulator DegU